MSSTCSKSTRCNASPFAILAGAISYGMFGLQDGAEKWFWWLAIMVAVTWAGAAFLMMVGTLCKNFEMSNGLGMIFLIIFMLFDGFYVNPENIPSYYRWLEGSGFLSPAVHGLAANEFRGLNFTCTEAEAELGCVANWRFVVVVDAVGVHVLDFLPRQRKAAADG